MTAIFGEIFESDLKEILDNSRLSLQKLDRARILILGGTGFVGTWLVSALLYANELLDLNLQVTVVTRDKALAEMRLQASDVPALKVIEMDLQRDVHEGKGPFTHLIHAATPSSPRTGGLDADYVTDVSLRGTRYLIGKAKSQSFAPVMLHVSSGAVYGPQGPDTPLLLEKTPTAAAQSLNAYARAKLEVEKSITDAGAAGIVRGVNPRLFAFAGPHIALDAHFAVGNFVHDALYSGKITLKGNPKTVRSYLYPTDMTSWLIACLANPTLQPLHIGSDNPMEMQEVVSRISSLAGGIPVTSGCEAAPITRYVPATIETQKYLGVEQRVSFEDGIERWMRWLKN